MPHSPSAAYQRGYAAGIRARLARRLKPRPAKPGAHDYAVGFSDGYLFGVPDTPVWAEACPTPFSEAQLNRWAAQAAGERYQEALAEIAHVSRLLNDRDLYTSQCSQAIDAYFGGLDG